ncbi:hypothetical protein ACIQV3_36060 [Streptomyces sp. NPDC099050]|uniref:hypothetical protein n=1 Tax=Streptomyces sp. NPDC099050 TaxID=3366100 RepID=UPI003825B174
MSISGMFAQVAAQPVSSAVATRTDAILDDKPKPAADPFAPKLLDLDTLTGTDEERLALLEGAIEAAQNTLADNVRDARFRAEVEIGFTLNAIRSLELHVAKFGTIENYGETRWGYKRSTLYELMDTAPIRIAMSGIPDTSNRKGIEPPKPRTAPDASVGVETPTEEAAEAVEETAEAAEPRSVALKLSKSQALKLVPVWNEAGEKATREVLADAVQEAEKKGRKLTAAGIEAARVDWGVPQTSTTLPPSEEQRRREVNKVLADAAETAEKLVIALGALDMEETPPLDHDSAERSVKALRTVGRWLNDRKKLKDPVQEAEIVAS